MERLLVLFFFKGGKRGNKGVQMEPFFCDCFCFMVSSVAMCDSKLCKFNTSYCMYIQKSEIEVSILKLHFGCGHSQLESIPLWVN